MEHTKLCYSNAIGWTFIRAYNTYAYGGVCVNFSKLMHTGHHLHDDPFVFHVKEKKYFILKMKKEKDGPMLVRLNLETCLIRRQTLKCN